MEIVQFKNWKFDVDKSLTIKNYSNVIKGGAELCLCNDCRNYIQNRENVFPEEVKTLFLNLGIDYKKEVEILSYQILQNGLHHIAGWFHFKGKIIDGKDFRRNIGNESFQIELVDVCDNFSIGFCEQNSLTFFEDKEGLIQVEFEAYIPWSIDKSLETK
ncbi:hypothetical protein [Flavobacterium sp. KACC 22761]|uniref:hypothetical protein n=1 Tax=Flavobacterium sp. KACC 22761 TaxID=3092665 RepID=UPI002A75B881|nr:hypothetical protein [Flavobacterium sp. KACC 22761]WPO78956.1 hypothetical protein SCB73_00910 [Flavobacterium sp. KACC 22761]